MNTRNMLSKRSRSWFVTSVAISSLIAISSAEAANFVTFTYTAVVDGTDSSLGGTLAPAGLVGGETVTGYLTFDLQEPDDIAALSLGGYSHSVTPASLYAEVGGVVFQTNPSAVSVDVFIINSSSDLYALSSDNNTATMGVAAPDFFDFQLEDSAGLALTNDDQPTAPFDVNDFDPYSMLGSRLVIEFGSDYSIFAAITSIEANLIVDEDGRATQFDCDAPTAVCFPTIQSAISALGAGATIEVCPGIYNEDVEVPLGSDDILLYAIDGSPSSTIIKGQANVAAASFPLAVPNINILANGIEIHGFTIQGPDPVAGFYSSGMVIGGDDVNVHDNYFEVTNSANFDGISQAIQTYRDTNNPGGGNVDGLTITNNTFSHHGAGDAGYEAIFLNHVNSDPTPTGSVTISNNVFSGKLLRGVTSERSNIDISENDFSTELLPLDGSLDVGESLQAVNIQDFNGRDQQDIRILRNTIGAAPVSPPGTLIITGVIDGPLSGGTPKAVELYATGDIADLSDFGLGSANNGGGTDGEEFTFPADSVTGGTFIYVASEATQFSNWFGFAPDYVNGTATAVNGDDAVELFFNGSVIDVFGEINMSGTGQPWEYLDGWAYRNAATGPDGITFNVANWSFSGPNALDGETTNGSAVTPFPTGTYTPAPPAIAGAFGQGVRLGSGTQVLSNIVVENNAINSNRTGILVRSSADGVSVFDNDLSGNLDLGADNLDAADLNASGNWWGDFDASAVAAEVGFTVDYTPWLAVDTDTDGGTAGFQGDFSTLYVDDDSPQTGLVGRIQEGVDLVTASTVHVVDGTYIEQVYVYKSVNLLGANAGVNPNGGPRGAESIVLVDETGPDPFVAPFPIHFYLDADDIVVDGFLLDGDNPSLNSGEDLNGADLDAIEAIASYEGIANITIQNNIIRNTSYTGIDLYNFTNSGAPTDGNLITQNLIENLGAFGWGIGVLIYNDFYADITDNVITDVRVGIQTGNFNDLHPSALTSQITDNEISSRRVGIFYNLHYGNASPFNVSDNEISGVNDPFAPIDARWFGMLISSQQTAVDADFANNEIDGAGITGYLSAGIVAWNTPTTSELRIEGGSVSNVDYGVWVNNFEGYNSNGGNTSLAVDALTVDADLIGVYVLDSPSNTNGSSVYALVENNTEVSGAQIAGVLVEGADASATLKNNLASIVGNEVGVVIDGGTALLERNNLSGNITAGLIVSGDALVDAGDMGDTNSTGLGTGTAGPNGSSIGCNFLAGYNGTSSFAIDNQNLDADDGGAGIDVLAEGNFWGTEVLSEIEDVVNHTNDTEALTLVLFDFPKSVPQLVATGPQMCSNNMPAQVSVTISVENLPLSIHGYFGTVGYDTGVLQFNAMASSYTAAGESVFPLHTSGEPKPHENTVGFITVEAARSLIPPNPGTDQNTDVATLVFDVVGCGETTVEILPLSMDGPFMSEVSFQGIGLTTELISDSFLIDTGIPPASTISMGSTSGQLDNMCSTVVELSATISDDCCMELGNGADVTVTAEVLLGSATLGMLDVNLSQGVDETEVVVSAMVPATLTADCDATIQFRINGNDCCGNPMVEELVPVIITDDVDPVFVDTPGSLDIVIECDESTIPGILLGTTDPSSGIAIYYNNNGGGEDGLNNVAYMKAQASYGNTNAAPFSFDTSPLSGNGLLTWAGLFGQVLPPQHGIDLVLEALSSDASVSTPLLTAYENGDNSIGGRIAAGDVTWAINDYKGSSPNGPANPATSIINSVFRSATPGNAAVDIQDLAVELTQAGPVYTANVSGRLVNDGLIHWYTIGTPNSPVSNFALGQDFFFSGELTYDSTGDDGSDLVDFYAGQITISANSPNYALGFPLSTDNCTLFPALSYDDVVTPGNCVSNVVETIERTWTATDNCGNEATFVQTITVVDTTPPVVEQPADIVVMADAGGCDALVTVPPLVVSDNCSSLTITNDFNGSADASDIYPSGMPTTVTWTVTDACGNSTQVSQQITVDPVSTVNLVVTLPDNEHVGAPDTPLSFTRPIRFKLVDGSTCGPELCEEVTFTGSPSETPTAMVSLTVPCGAWTGVCAKDEQLSLNSTTTLNIVGPNFEGDMALALPMGDTDNDGDVDINDVTYLLFAFASSGNLDTTCPFDAGRSADFSLNGTNFTEDFTILQTHWLETSNCGCTNMRIVGDDDREFSLANAADVEMLELPTNARATVAVRLIAATLPAEVASKVDVNRDGVIDDLDVRVFEDRLGLSNELSRKIRRSIELRELAASDLQEADTSDSRTGVRLRR